MSFCRHRRSSRRIDAGVSGGKAVQSGSDFSTAGEGLGYGVTGERPAPRQHLVEHAAERPDIGAPVDRLPLACSGLM